MVFNIFCFLLFTRLPFSFLMHDFSNSEKSAFVQYNRSVSNFLEDLTMSLFFFKSLLVHFAAWEMKMTTQIKWWVDVTKTIQYNYQYLSSLAQGKMERKWFSEAKKRYLTLKISFEFFGFEYWNVQRSQLWGKIWNAIIYKDLWFICWCIKRHIFISLEMYLQTSHQI